MSNKKSKELTDCNCELTEGCRKCLGLDIEWRGESILTPIYDEIIRYFNLMRVLKEFNKKFGYPKE